MRRALAGLIAAGVLTAAVATGLATPVGRQQQISQPGAPEPSDAVAVYNPQTNQTLVVFRGDDPSNGNQDDPDSLFVRLVDASGNPVGAQRQISDSGSPNFARAYSAAYNPDDNAFIVAWSGGSGTNEDIKVQLLDAAGNEVGPNDLPVTDGVDNQGNSVTYNPAADRYLVVWEEEGADQVLGQQLTRTGAETGPNDFRISNAPEDAEDPDVIHNVTANEYLVAWTGELANGEDEIFARRLDSGGGGLGGDFRVSQQTAAGSGGPPSVEDPDIVHNTTRNEYLVTWEGERFVSTVDDDDLDEEVEIFGQRLSAGGGALGRDFRITTHGADGDAAIDTGDPAGAYDGSRRQYLVAWQGDTGPGEDHSELFASCLDARARPGGVTFMVSRHGPEGDDRFGVGNPDVVFNTATRDYFAAWPGNVTPNAVEVFGRRLNCRAPTLARLNADDPPTLGRDVNVGAVKGRVLVAVRRGASAAQSVPGLKGVDFVPLQAARQIPVGSFVDTRRGTVGLTSARNRRGRLQSGQFAAGVFQVVQGRRSKGLTELRLKGSAAGFKRCRGGKADARSSALSRRAIRRLRARARGRYRTRGRHSAATVRGTVWTTTDRCDGTLTKVKRGKVAVRDFRLRKTIVLKAGKSYLAAAVASSNR